MSDTLKREAFMPILCRIAAARFFAALTLAGATLLVLIIAVIEPSAAAAGIVTLAITAAGLLATAQRNAAPANNDTPPPLDEESEDFAEDLRENAEFTRRRQAMQGLADALEVHLSGLVAQVGGRAQEMRGIADAVAAIAERSGENIVVTRTAAEESVDAARALSFTTTQLEESIATISKQMTEATDLARGAVAAGAEARMAMSQLTDQLASVRLVTEKITNLARQTNLLALNATIESARAGAAGSGFAVVAAEVKALARQTTDLTLDIGQIIGAVVQVNLDAVKKVDQMEQRIVCIETIATTIASEMAAQRTTIDAISTSVQQTSGAADQLSSRVDSLTESMMENLDQTAMVHVSASALVEDADQMETSLRQTITKAVRSAVPESDRRRFKRYPVSEALQASLGARLEIGNDQPAFRLLDISDSGCRISVAELSTRPLSGWLFLSARPNPVALKFVSREPESGQTILGVQFTHHRLDAAALVNTLPQAA